MKRHPRARGRWPRGGPRAENSRAGKPEARGTGAPLELRHPAMIAAMIAAAASVLLSAGYRLYDTDLWTLLVTGKAIWTQHALPMTNQWTWPNFGAREVLSSWLFRALLWPVWSAGGVIGLFAWRWALELTTFALIWITARAPHLRDAPAARGASALLVIAWCALVARLRTDIRPEALGSLLFALSLWILETRRTGGPDRRAWLVPIACVWANAHPTWYLLFFLWALYLWDGRGGRPWKWVALSAAALFVQPYGLAALRQPFDFAFTWRAERIFQGIGELQPLDLSSHVRDGFLILVALWAGLALWRWRRSGFDRVEIFGGVLLLVGAFRSQRFLGAFALFIAPFLARDLAEALAALPRGLLPRPPRGFSALAAAAGCLLIGIPEWSNPALPLGVALEADAMPVAACDFVQARGIRGRAFNDFHLGGYVAWRFWPDRARLPFMTTQPENSKPEDRAAIVEADLDESSWRTLDARCNFDWLLLDRLRNGPRDSLLTWVGRDSSFACVFMDDAAYLFVRRAGAMAAVADSFRFRIVPATSEGREELIARCEEDAAARSAARVEFQRQALDSPRNAFAEQALGTLALMDGRYGEARIHLERALAVRPSLESARRMLEAAHAAR
jgi:hypothetical protein